MNFKNNFNLYNYTPLQQNMSNLVNHQTAGYRVGSDTYKCNVISYQAYPRNVYILTTSRGNHYPDVKYFKHCKKNNYWYEVEQYEEGKFRIDNSKRFRTLDFTITETQLDPSF